MQANNVDILPSLAEEAEGLLAWLFQYPVRPAFELANVPSYEGPSLPLDLETVDQLGVLV